MNEGKKDRRDPIRTIKPRNFVAKNASATTSGAGAHKDKKKATTQVRGAKHKKKDYAEHLESLLSSAITESADMCRVCGCTPCNCTHIVAESEKNPHTSALGRALYRDLSKEKKASPAQVQRNKERWAKRQAERGQGVSEGFDNYLSNAIHDLGMSKPGLDRESFLDELYSYLDAEFGKGVADRAFANEDDLEFDDWYDQYQSIAESESNEDPDLEKLNAWKREVLNAYPQIAGKVKFKGIGNQVSAEVPGIDRSFGVFDLETMTGDVLGETKVRWTHDSLADLLFDHERTYEDELQNKLNEAIKNFKK